MMEVLRTRFLYWSDQAIVEYLQRRVIVHSILYYEMDESVITDRQFDKLARELVVAQGVYNKRELRSKTKYGYVLHDFDATTGFHLESRLKKRDRWYLTGIAKHVLWLYKKEGSA